MVKKKNNDKFEVVCTSCLKQQLSKNRTKKKRKKFWSGLINFLVTMSISMFAGFGYFVKQVLNGYDVINMVLASLFLTACVATIFNMLYMKVGDDKDEDRD